MRVSLEWLADYVDIDGLAPQAIADALTLSGLEVESVEALGAKFNNVVLARCLKLEPHPNADKLRLATVNLGAETTRVVCGAKNLSENMLIAFAKDGAQVINRKDGSLFTLGKATIRGVESVGMICSLEELGLENTYPKSEDGIWPLEETHLPKDALADDLLGQDLKTVLGMSSDDVILHTAPTANRGDLMSIIGVAREIAALFDREIKFPEVAELSATENQPAIEIQLNDPAVCRYYGGLILENAKALSSPAWMIRRLEASGTRAINAVVDVTNYVMLEMGQPLHAFDRDKFSEQPNQTNIIQVRRATVNEPFTTLDGQIQTLTPESVLITINDQPVALAGVMGGENTEISEDSTRLLLEAAYFTPATNRKNAKSVGIRTESSARFERGVDLYQTQHALFRAGQLLSELTGATVIGLTQSPLLSPDLPHLTLRIARIKQMIGLEVPKDRVVSILIKLGFTVSERLPEILNVTVPSWRLDDVTREIDLIEEVIRIYGYDQVPYTLPKKVQPVPFSLRQNVITRVQDSLQASGCHQVMGTSLIGEALLEKTASTLEASQRVNVKNSSSIDHTTLRQSVLPNLLEALKHNLSQGMESVWIYELGKTYFNVGKSTHKQTGINERLTLGVLLSGSPQQGVWRSGQHLETDFYTLKGMIENLFSHLFGNTLPALTFKAEKSEASQGLLHPGKSAEILLDGKPIGILGEVHPVRQLALKLRQSAFALELNLELVFKRLKQSLSAPTPVRLSPYPAVDRDMALLVDSETTHQNVLETIQSVQEALLKDVALFDEYRGDKLPEGSRSLAYRLTFQSQDQTLTDAQIDTAVQRIKKTLTDRLPVQLR